MSFDEMIFYESQYNLLQKSVISNCKLKITLRIILLYADNFRILYKCDFMKKHRRSKENNIENSRNHSQKTTARRFVIELFESRTQSASCSQSTRNYNTFNNILSILLMAPTFERFYYTVRIREIIVCCFVRARVFLSKTRI